MSSQPTLEALTARLTSAGLRVHDASPEPADGKTRLADVEYPYVVLYADPEPGAFRRRAGVVSHRTLSVQAVYVGLTPRQVRWATDRADSVLTGWHPTIPGRASYRCRHDWPGQITLDRDIPGAPLYSVTIRYQITSIQR